MNKVKVICPLCGVVGEVRQSLVGNKYGIDDAKCSLCLEERGVFVNLQLTNFEKQRLNNSVSNQDDDEI